MNSVVEYVHATAPLDQVSGDIYEQAQAYLQLFQQEQAVSEIEIKRRLNQVQEEIEQVGTYWQTPEELAYGAKVAWRNSSRCIGRLHWTSLTVRDMRHLSTEEEIFEALVEHIKQATNGGKIRSLITIFAQQIPGQPGMRIWNPQLIRYAGYRQPDGTVIGDPAQVELTETLMRMGWEREERTQFDILPIVIQLPHRAPRFFTLPQEIVLEVPLSHPVYPWFAELGLKWYALPVISNMCLEVGGVCYTAAPFNGWYMGTEIGARNLADQGRYNLLPVVAKHLELDMRSDRTLWKDRALVELNIAVLHSFSLQGITIVDHHKAAKQFVTHESQEKKAGRSLCADWGWIVPPMSAATTPVFHRSYQDEIVRPNFFYQDTPSLEGCPMLEKPIVMPS